MKIINIYAINHNFEWQIRQFNHSQLQKKRRRVQIQFN